MGPTTFCSTFPVGSFSFYQTIGSAISVSGNALLYIAYDESVVIRLNGVSVFSGTTTVSSISTQPWMFFQLVTLPALSSVSDNILEVRVTNTAASSACFNVYFPTNFTADSEVTIALKQKANKYILDAGVRAVYIYNAIIIVALECVSLNLFLS